MGKFRSQNLFYLLMTTAFVVTFMLPSRASSKFRPQLGIVFAPVSRSAASIARLLGGKTQVISVNDHRTDESIREENEQLRGEVGRLSLLVKEAARRDTELAQLGDIKDLCVLAAVTGADTGGRESITLAGRTLSNVKVGMYALVPGTLVGRVDAVGAASAQVRLITDPGVRLRCRFTSYVNGTATRVAVPQVVVEGRGDGLMVARQLTLVDLRLDASMKPIDATGAALHEGDYCQLDDPDCPQPVQGLNVGRVESITPRPGGRLFAEILIRPVMSLKRLPETMILNRER